MLEIIKELGIKNYSTTKRTFVLVKCSLCGKKWELPKTQARRNKTGRCRECFQTKHNQSSRNNITKEYGTWLNMKQRCYNKNDKHYADYGGRGITICDQWLNSFDTFFKDMGKKEKGLSIDRIDNNGNYEPTNCRWATPSQQILNTRKRKNTKSKYRGVTPRKYGYRARVGISGKITNIGSYKTELEAARAYDRYILDNNLPNKRNW